MKIIKWYNSDIVYESEKETIKETVIEAVSRGANLGDADLGGANFYHTYFYGKGGNTRIKKSQVESFHIALGIIVEED